MLAPGTAPRETVEGGRVDRAPAPPARSDRLERTGGPRRARRDGARARREHRRGQEVLV